MRQCSDNGFQLKFGGTTLTENGIFVAYILFSWELFSHYGIFFNGFFTGWSVHFFPGC